MKDTLLTALKKLRLSGLLSTLEVRLHEAVSHQLSHEEFLELALQDELLIRNERLIQRRVKAAGFRELKTLDDVDWSFNPSIKKKQIFDLASGHFIREARDILWIGPPGTGKSMLTQLLGYQAIKLGFTVLYRSIFDVVRDFLQEETLAEGDRVLARYLKPDLLIVDDMGMKQLPKRSGECLFEVIMRRYETRSTMMTSNRPLEDWGKLIGDVPSATAILDRFLHHAEVIQMTGRSYRLRHQASGNGAGESKPAKAPTGSDEVNGEAKPAKALTGSAAARKKAKPAKAPTGSDGARPGSKPAKAPIGSEAPSDAPKLPPFEDSTREPPDETTDEPDAEIGNSQ